MMNVKEIVKEIAQGREEFIVDYETYKALDIEVKKELDRNYWRFPLARKGYMFEEMDEDAKAHFAGQEMVIHHSIFEC